MEGGWRSEVMEISLFIYIFLGLFGGRNSGSQLEGCQYWSKKNDYWSN